MRYDKVDPWTGPITEGQIKTIEYEIGEQPEQFSEDLVNDLRNLSKLEAAWLLERVKYNPARSRFNTSFNSYCEPGMTGRQYSAIKCLIVTIREKGIKLPADRKLANKFLGRLIDCLNRSQASKLIVYLQELNDTGKVTDALTKAA